MGETASRLPEAPGPWGGRPTKKNPGRSSVRGLAGRSARAFEESFELSAPHGVLELADGLGLDLADAFARHLEDAADLLKGVGVAVAEAVAELDDLAFAVG